MHSLMTISTFRLGIDVRVLLNTVTYIAAMAFHCASLKFVDDFAVYRNNVHSVAEKKTKFVHRQIPRKTDWVAMMAISTST